MKFEKILKAILIVIILIIVLGTICIVSKELKQKKIADRIPILTFHRIVPDEIKNEKHSSDEWVASAKIFDEQMQYLHDNGYTTISMDEFYSWYKGKCEFPKKTVMIVLDDGNLEDYYIVLPILKKYNFKATSFIVGKRAESEDSEYEPYKRKFITKELISRTEVEYPNLQYQSHTYDMHTVDSNGKRRLENYTKEQIVEDFEKNSEFEFKDLAYPYGWYDEEIIEVLKEKGYRFAFTFTAWGQEGYATRKSAQYEIPRIKINGFSNVNELKKWLEY